MQKLKICLVPPPTRASTMTVPIGLLYLHSWLKKEGVRAEIIDIKAGRAGIPPNKQEIEFVKEGVLEELSEKRPEYVGITCFTTEFWEVIELSKLIREKVQTKIIIGGIHANIKPEDFLFAGSPVDIVINGDGMETLVNVVKSGGSLEELKKNPGVLVRDKSGIFCKGEPKPFSRWADMPNPDYKQLDMAYYCRPDRGLIRSVFASGVHIFTTIGCPFQCTFCGNRNRKVSFRSIDNVIEEIRLLKERYRIDSFYIQDDTFCLKRGRVKEFAEKLNREKLGLFWGMETRVNMIDDALVKTISEAGCIQIDFGVETGSERALLKMKKGTTNEETVEAFELCKKYKLRTFANIMLNIPEETEADIDDTRALLKKIKPTRMGIGLTVPFPGTEIYDEYINPPLTVEEYTIYNDPNLFLTIVDPRFYLARHSVNLPRMRIKIQTQCGGIRAFLDVTSNLKYWRGLIKSKRKLQYLKSFINDFFMERGVKAFNILSSWK